jgi:hypothetical protein
MACPNCSKPKNARMKEYTGEQNNAGKEWLRVQYD